jgi:outer membrane receptor for ferrienterochelin and colicins
LLANFLNKITYQISTTLAVVLVCLCTLQSSAQQIIVLNKSNNLPVYYAQVYYKCNIHNDCNIKPRFNYTDSLGIVKAPEHELLVTVKATGYYHVNTIKPAGRLLTVLLEPNPNYLDEIVVTGQYSLQSIDNSVVKVKVIDAKQIQQQGAFNLQQILANQINVRISQDPALGSIGLQLQGVSGNNIKILVDGVPVIGREAGNIDLAQLNLNNIERVEIVEGPMSVNYGTDALGGVINLITKQPQPNKITSFGGMYYESIGQYNADAGVNLSKKKYSANLLAGRNFFEGFTLEPGSRNMLWKPRTQYFGNLNVKKQITNGYIQLNNSFFSEKLTNKGIPTIDWTKATAQDQYFYTNRFSSSLFYNQYHDTKRRINLVASYNFYSRVLNTYLKDLVTLNQELIPSNAVQDTSLFHNIMSRGTYANTFYSTKLKYETGYEVNSEWAIGYKIEGKQRNVTDLNAFASAEYLLYNRLLIKPALRYTHHSLFAAPLIPSLNIKYDFAGWLSLRVSYGRGFRAPSLKEVFLEFVDLNHNIKGNRNLTPETSDNLQAYMMYKKQTSKHVLSIEPGIFYNNINNMINLARTGEGNQVGMQYVNINNFKSKGFNLNADFKTPVYNISAGYAFIGMRNNLGLAAMEPEWLYTHEIRLNTGYTVKKTGTTLSLFTKYNGFMQAYEFSYFQNKVVLNYIESFTLVDATATQHFFNRKITITGGFKNLLNVSNINASLVTGVHGNNSNFAPAGFGRTFFMSLKFNFDH